MSVRTSGPQPAAAAHRRRRATCVVVALWGMACGCRTPPADDAPFLEAETAQQEVARLSNQVATLQREAPPPVPETVLRAGDRLTVRVWLKDKISQLSGYPLTADVPDRGDVFLPHLGLVRAQGRSAAELQADLQERFARILNDVVVIVSPSGERTEAGGPAAAGTGSAAVAERPHVILLGHIVRPGLYGLTPGMRVLDAVAEAGGLGHYGHPRIYLVRGERDRPHVKRIDMRDLYTGRTLKENIRLSANDVLYVAPKQIWRTADFIATLLLPVTSVRDAFWVYDRSTGAQ